MDIKTHFDYIKNVGTLFGRLAHKNSYVGEFKNYGIKFWPNEVLFLQKWYMWFEGLVNDDIKPISRQQQNFLDYFKTIESKPPSRHSKGYAQLKKEQKILLRYYYIRKFGAKVKKIGNLNHPDSIYFYAKNNVEFGSGRYLPLKYKGTYLEKKLNDSRNQSKP